jgi:hypothetical protein
MATCTTSALVDGKMIGDPIDMIMFEKTGWGSEE